MDEIIMCTSSKIKTKPEKILYKSFFIFLGSFEKNEKILFINLNQLNSFVCKTIEMAAISANNKKKVKTITKTISSIKKSKIKLNKPVIFDDTIIKKLNSSDVKK